LPWSTSPAQGWCLGNGFARNALTSQNSVNWDPSPDTSSILKYLQLRYPVMTVVTHPACALGLRLLLFFSAFLFWISAWQKDFSVPGKPRLDM
jgi:hypothetical protein